MQTSQIVIELTVLVLAIFVGVEVISKVPTLLHTPLMSGTNAIHGIVLVGAIIVAGLPHQVTWIRVVALTAVALGTINVVGGFVVTDRMLAMFKGKRRDAEPAQPAIGEGGRVERVREHREARATSTSDHDGR
jgi:proton-translocating NAD(P)+ transhydrogenase subunit alpha